MLRGLEYILVLSLASVCHAVHLYFKPGQLRCLQKDVGGGVTVSGIYRIEVYDEATGQYTWQPYGYGIHVYVYDERGKEMMNRVYSTAADKFQFFADKEERNTICLRANVTAVRHSKSVYRMYLRFEPATHEYFSVERVQELKKGLARYLNHLLNSTKHIMSEQGEVRMREDRFRDTSESTNSRILHWMFIQTVLGILLFIWQASHLKSFIVKKKLV